MIRYKPYIKLKEHCVQTPAFRHHVLAAISDEFVNSSLKVLDILQVSVATNPQFHIKFYYLCIG